MGIPLNREMHNENNIDEKSGLLSLIHLSASSSSLTSSITKSYGSLVDNCHQAVKYFWNRSKQVGIVIKLFTLSQEYNITINKNIYFKTCAKQRMLWA
jgi:hypothetical protein